MSSRASILNVFGLCAAFASALTGALPASAAQGAAPGFRYWNLKDTAATPKTLSAMGLYKSLTAKTKILADGARHYEVNSPLWSDAAEKERWVLLKPGTSIGFREADDYWDYPEDAVFIKDFDIDTIPGNASSRVRWETRVMVNAKEPMDGAEGALGDRWYMYTYKWDADQMDARLVGAEGMEDAIRIWPQGTGKPSRMKKWKFPSRNQCQDCHRTWQNGNVHGRTILGFFTAQLNRPSAESASVNQLDAFFSQGLLTGKRPILWDYSPRWRSIEDNTASVDLRARSYIAANCSGCHGSRGKEVGATFGVDLDYDFHAMEVKMEFRHKSTSWAFGLDTIPPTGMAKNPLDHYYYPKNDPNNPNHKDSLEIMPALVVPGYPEKSVILFRQTSRNTRPGDYDPDRNQMPPLASFEVNEAATQLIAKWIKEMPAIPAPGCCTPTAIRTHGGRTTLNGPAIENRQVVLPMELAGAGQVRVILTGIDGRAIELVRKSRTHYALPAHITPGVYFIKVNNKSFIRHLF